MSRERSVDSIGLTDGIESFDARVVRERKGRLENGAKGTSFGIDFLDDALGGLYPNDLVVVGAKSGIGKTQLGTLLALSNAKAGRRVLYFALEAEENEIERRIKYQVISDRFYKLPRRPPVRMSYIDWYYGKLDQHVFELEEQYDMEPEHFPTLHTYYRRGSFDVKDFERIFLGRKDEFDLFVIDHLHYFDTTDENENRAVKNIVKKIRDCALIGGKPVVLIAHVRKSDRKAKQLIPDLEDFHGTSDIGKIATKAIAIAPCYEGSTQIHKPTYFAVTKCRVDGTRAFAAATLAFNIQSQRYEPGYYTGSFNYDLTEFKPDTMPDVPWWATRAQNTGGL